MSPWGLALIEACYVTPHGQIVWPMFSAVVDAALLAHEAGLNFNEWRRALDEMSR